MNWDEERDGPKKPHIFNHQPCGVHGPRLRVRIHLTLTYPELTHDSRLKVWKSFIESLHVDTSAMTDDETGRLAEKELNGRQIKNVVKMAGLLAADNGGKLNPEDLDTILRIGRGNKLAGEGSEGGRHEVSFT